MAKKKAHDVETIPEPYRDFLMALKSIVDTRDSVMRITAIPVSRVYGSLYYQYRYTLEQVREMAHTLAREGLISAPDAYDFIAPTPRGDELIRRIAGRPEPVVATVPPFPKLAD